MSQKKRRAFTPPSTLRSSKKNRLSGTDAMFKVAQAISSIGNAFADSASGSQITPSPIRRANVVKQVFKEMEMSDDEAIQVTKMLRAHTDIGDMYAAILSKSHRINYLRSELNDFIEQRLA